VAFDGPGADEDFGLDQGAADPSARYKFRTSPIRNVALQPVLGRAISHNPFDFGAWLGFDAATVTKIKISPGTPKKANGQ
jgi:hypothetical protein